MQTRSIAGISVSAIGLGAMPMSVGGYPVEEVQALATIHAALDAGVRLIDTADAYAPSSPQMGHNEVLVNRALASWGADAADVLVATKGGHTRYGESEWGTDGSPAYLRKACEASLRRLGVETIGLYQHHRPDPDVPYEETIGALRDLREEGKIRLVGISNADVKQIETAQRVLGAGGLASVQNQFSPRFRSSEDELAYCAEQDIAFLPWSPLGGMGEAADLGSTYAAFAEVAEAHGASPQQVCLSWELAKAPVVVPIPGASRPQTITDSAAAAGLSLTPEEIARLDASSS